MRAPLVFFCFFFFFRQIFKHYLEQDRRRILPEPGAVVPRGEHRLRRTEQRGHQEARPGGVVPGLRGVPRAGVVLQLHRLPGE